MARKIDLKGLYNAGTLNVTVFGTEDGASDGVSALFNGEDTSLKLIIVNPNAPATETITLTFNAPIPADKIRIKTTHRLVGDFDIQINGDSSTDINVSSINPPGKSSTVNDFNTKSISSIQYTLNAGYGSLPNTYEFYEIELFILDEADPYEFNDSVLSTKGWNSSRYDGRQLQGSTINEYNDGDISYGNTPVVRDMCRTFYLATEVVSLSNTGSAIEDSTLQYIPNFSYVIVDKSVTVNKDDTIVQFNTNNISNNTGGANQLIGFNREFQTNIPISSNVGLVNYDESINNRSKKNYTVYFNRGRFQPFIRLKNNATAITDNEPKFENGVCIYATPPGIFATMNGQFHVLNKQILQSLYTGSLKELTDSPTSSTAFGVLLDFVVEKQSTNKIYTTMLNTSGSTDKTKPDFISNTPLEVIRTVAEDEGGSYPTRNLAELSTVEITEVNFPINRFSYRDDSPFSLNQNYIPGTGPFLYSGSFDISILNEEKPSLLINMNKKSELPQGKGSKPIVVIPENLHPFIKDNLVHFCAKAGLDIGDRKVVPALDESNRNLK